MKNPKEIFAKIRSLGAKPVLAYRADTEPKDDLIELAPLCEWIFKAYCKSRICRSKNKSRSNKTYKDDE